MQVYYMVGTKSERSLNARICCRRIWRDIHPNLVGAGTAILIRDAALQCTTITRSYSGGLCLISVAPGVIRLPRSCVECYTRTALYRIRTQNIYNRRWIQRDVNSD